MRAVVNTGTIGHAGRPRQRCPGGHVTTVHRGRCTLQAAAKPALRNMTQRAWKLYPDNPPTSRLRRNIPTRTPRRGRRPRRPFRRMTDDVFAMRKHSPHVVGRTVPGAPPSIDRLRRFHAPPHLRARHCVADVRRDRLQPRFHRCARLVSIAPRMRFRGHSPRTIFTGAPTLTVDRRRAGVEARPYGRHPHCTHVAPTPQSRRYAP